VAIWQQGVVKERIWKGHVSVEWEYAEVVMDRVRVLSVQTKVEPVEPMVEGNLP
jgi:hypothetical protein